MPLDTNIPLSFKPTAELQIQSPINQMAQLMQLRQAQSQNELAQYQLGAAQRAETRDVGRINALAEAGTDDTAIANALLKSGDLKGYAEFLKSRRETQKADVELADAKLKQSRQFLDTVKTPEEYIAWHEANHKDPILGPMLASRGITAEQSRARIMSAIQTPGGFEQLLNESKLGTEKFMELNKPTTFAQDTGTGGRVMSRPGLGGPATLVPGSEFTKGMTFADKNAAARLAFEKYKFAFEQANPTMSVQEDANGLLAVNTRTGVATPIVYGPNGFQAAPAAAAAPAASIMRQQGSGIPTQRIPAVPGMTSVLDQNIAPTAMPLPSEGGARVPGAPVGGKERNLPEHFVKTDMQLANLAGSVRSFKDEVARNKNTSAKWLPTGADTANMQAKYISLLMGVKDLYTLGALTGPDLSLIEAQITNPASWSGKFTTKAGFESQIKVIEDMVDRGAKSLENSYGKVPKATKAALQSSPPLGGGGIPGATATNPLGLPGL